MEYYFDRYLGPDVIKNIAKKKLAVRTLLSKIKAIWSPVEKAHWITELSARSGVKERDLLEELERVSLGEREVEDPVIETTQGFEHFAKLS